MSYITVDLDDPSVVEVLRAWKRVKYYSDSDKIHGRVSSSGSGVHIASSLETPEDIPVNERERLLCFDDEKRVKGDKYNDIKSNQVLFDSKGGKDSGRWFNNLNDLVKEYV